MDVLSGISICFEIATTIIFMGCTWRDTISNPNSLSLLSCLTLSLRFMALTIPSPCKEFSNILNVSSLCQLVQTFQLVGV